MDKEFIVYSITKSSFQSLVDSGEITNSQIGIISETSEFWAKGQYYPLVNLGEYLKKDDSVALAKDLTGALEATPEEFTFRPSAGDKSIRDESAVIRRIKGNTNVWNQHIRNGDFALGVLYSTGVNTTLSDNGDGTINVNNKGTGSDGMAQALASPIPTGHKVLIVIDYKRSSAAVSNVLFYLTKSGTGIYDKAYIYSLSSDVRRVDGAIIETTNDVDTLLFYPFIKGAAGDYVTMYSYMAIDLTAIFGKGNEPSSYEEFREVYTDSYYPYCEPEIRNMRAWGIETIGANAFNKDDIIGGLINADGTVTSNDIYSMAKIEVVPYEKYTLTNVANAANTTYTYALYDREDRFISVGEIRNSVTKPVSVSGDVIMPLNARYIRVVVHNDYLDSCCVNLKHSGTLTAEEATYFKEVRMLPDIAKYFPEGMHGIGDVYDEINEENIVKRFGVVDLGTLDWITTGTANNVDKRIFSNGLIDVAKGAASHLVSNIMCNKYDAISANQNYLRNKGISLSQTSSGVMLHIYDPDYNSDDKLSDFVASLNGVLLYYELAEPIVTPITDPLQWTYKVADFGTEKILSDLPSSPFRADIVYQFNAADRIRDNARNIERLEEHTKNMATMEDVINAIPTEVATATQLEEYTVTDGSQLLYPNIMYEFSIGGIGQTGEFVMPRIVTTANRAYDNRWMLRIAQITNGATLTFPYEIAWRDGLEPNIPTSGSLEIYLKVVQYAGIIGEWKFYTNI